MEILHLVRGGYAGHSLWWLSRLRNCQNAWNWWLQRLVMDIYHRRTVLSLRWSLTEALGSGLARTVDALLHAARKGATDPQTAIRQV